MFLCAILDALIAFGEIAGVILLEVQTHTAFRGSYSIGCALATLQLLGKDFCCSQKEDLSAVIRRIGVLLEGNIRRALENSMADE